MRIFAIAIVALSILAAALPGSAQPTPQLTPVPNATRTPYIWGTAPPSGQAASARPLEAPVVNANLATFTGQVLDIRNGYVYFGTGDAFKIQPAVRVVDYFTGMATTIAPKTKMWAKATLDKQSGTIIELAITNKTLKTSATYNDVAYNDLHNKYVIVKSTPVADPVLANQVFNSGKPVLVTFSVEVPPSTLLTDSVFISTDASNWTPNAIRMDRVDALHFRLTRNMASGTKFTYKYTRGTWNQVERGRDGLEPPPREYVVKEADAQVQRDYIYFWSDQNPSQPQVGPDSIPTPFNPNPFPGFPSKIPPAHPTPTAVPR
jgi:hypothetical protein